MTSLVRITLVSLLLAAASVSAASDWEARATGEAGIEIASRNSPVARAHYVFWGENWKWAGAKIKLGEMDGDVQTFGGSVEALGLSIEGRITTPRANQIRYTWDVEAAKDLSGVVGGGLELNLVLNSPALGDDPPEPELLADNRGLSWAVGKGGVRIEFDPPAANCYFERGNKSQIRCMLFGENLAQGKHQFMMTVTLPEGGRIARTLVQRYGPVDSSTWYPEALRHDTSPVDLSFLNHKPAGKLGPVRASGDKLVYGDGSEARFWGGNIAAYAIYSDKQLIEAQAKRIARLGYNLMRIHHHDSMGWVGHTVIDKSRDDSQHLDAEVMDRLDYWIKCLKDEGVYVWLDLHVGRLFKPGDEIGEGYAEMARRSKRKDRGAEGKGYCYFNDRLEELMRDFNEKYLNHKNRYTGLAYKDDPAVMGLLITNENDLTCHFGNLMLPDKGNPWHNKRFEAAVAAFANKHGLPREQTWRTWEAGPSKLFLADWEHAWNRRMMDHLAGLGVKVPVSTTQMWGGMNLCGLPSLTAGTIIDVHSYGDSEALSTNPRYEDNYLTYFATGAAHGMPVSMTEWNVPYPAVDRFTAPLYVAGISALQGWDAPMIYNYSQVTFERPSRGRTWSSYFDPGLTAVTPAAAMLYRRGDVRPAKEHYCLMLDREKLYFEPSHPRNLAALRTLVEQSKLTLGLPDVEELDWDKATVPEQGVERVTDLGRDFIPLGQNVVRSDTGEIARDWIAGYQTIGTDRTQAAHGWVGGRRLQVKDTVFAAQTPKCALAVTSLDGEPIRQSKKILITAVARVVPSPGNKTPLLSEPVKASLEIAAPAGLKLVPLAADGGHLEPVATSHENGAYHVKLPAPRGTHWFLLTR